MDRGALRATKSWTQLKRLSTHACTSLPSGSLESKEGDRDVNSYLQDNVINTLR